MQSQQNLFPAIDQLRADTPGCQDSLFLNSAGASLMPQPVVKAMGAYLQQETQLGGYEVERLHRHQIDRLYEETARLLNTRPGNIAYAYSATDATIQALSAIPFRAGDTILTTTNDYVSNQLAFLSMQQRLGIQLRRINNLPNGELDLTHLEELLRAHRPVLVALTHVPTNSGMVLPAEEVGKLCRQYGAWYLLDAAQSVGQLPLDVARIEPDFLVATGRKFLRGPRNTRLSLRFRPGTGSGFVTLVYRPAGSQLDRPGYVFRAGGCPPVRTPGAIVAQRRAGRSGPVRQSGRHRSDGPAEPRVDAAASGRVAATGRSHPAGPGIYSK